MSLSSDAHAPITEHPAASLVFTLVGVALVLPVHEMTLHIHPLKGSGDGLCGSFKRPPGDGRIDRRPLPHSSCDSSEQP